MKTLIVIPCAGRKRVGRESGLIWTKPRSVAARLDAPGARRLLECRRDLARRYRYAEGPDLGGDPPSAIPLMIACCRYDGNLYRHVDATCWPRPEGPAGVEVVIVSALYGLLLPWEPIRYYNRTMKELIPPRLRLARWWVEHGLGTLLAEYVKRQGVEIVHDFLSGDYRVVASGLEALRGRLRIVPHSYPGLGSGSDYRRGDDVSRILRATGGMGAER